MSGYVALRRIRFGERFLEPGDEVPVQRGRNYGLMVRTGQVAEVRDPKARSSAAREKNDGERDLAEGEHTQGRRSSRRETSR